MYGDEEYLLSGSVLSTRNEDAGRVNNTVLRTPTGEEFELKSSDSAVKGGEDGPYPSGFINSLEIAGLQPNKIRINGGIPPIPIRNLNAESGMCNGRESILRRIRP